MSLRPWRVVARFEGGPRVLACRTTDPVVAYAALHKASGNGWEAIVLDETDPETIDRSAELEALILRMSGLAEQPKERN